MLLLTRKLREVIRIGDDITITVAKFNNPKQVVLGIDAPDNVSVHRQEIYEKIHKSKKDIT